MAEGEFEPTVNLQANEIIEMLAVPVESSLRLYGWSFNLVDPSDPSINRGPPVDTDENDVSNL